MIRPDAIPNDQLNYTFAELNPVLLDCFKKSVDFRHDFGHFLQIRIGPFKSDSV